MTLFDNKPLSEEEVNARRLCECGDIYGKHPEGKHCTACECEEFVEVKG